MFFDLINITITTEPNTPLNDADHVGSFNSSPQEVKCNNIKYVISYVRNICAHYGRLYNAKLSKTPILYKEYTQAGIGNNRIYAVLLCMKNLLKNDLHWNLFVDKIELLFDKYECVQIKTMGFPDNWKDILQN